MDSVLTPGTRPPARRGLAGQIGIVVGLVLLVLAATLALDARMAGTIEELRGLAREAAAQAMAADALLDALSEADNAQQGFLLTEQDSYLAPYQAATSKVGEALASLGRLGERSPWLPDATAALRVVVRDKLAELDRRMALARSGHRDEAVHIVLGGEGRALMDAARAQAAAVITRADSIREDRLGMVRRREREAAIGIVLVSTVGLALLGIAAVVLLAGRKRLADSEAALREQSERLAGTVANLRDGVAVFDAAGVLVLWNDNFFAASGLPRDLAARGVPFARFAAAAADWPGTPLGAPLPAATPCATEIASFGRTIDLWRAAMPDGGQMLAAIDATERVAADARARQASKMEALGQLTGGVAHDFNNLLQVISSNLELLRPLIVAEEMARQRLSAAELGIQHAARLTRHLLAFARRQPLAPDTIDPARLLSRMDELLGRTLGEAITIETRVAPGIWAIRADPHLLESALLNLALNARDAMPHGGALVLGASNVACAAAEGPVSSNRVSSNLVSSDLAAGDLAAGEYVAFTVSDTGHGMDDAVLARAMEPFFTTKSEGHGTGLGLPMVFGFARQSGGTLDIESTPGGGTTARLLIPRSLATPEPTGANDHDDEPPVRARGESVLAVEDDDAVRAAVIAALSSLGYRVTAASNAAAALSLLREGARPDILFTDMIMPGQPTALELAREARRLHPHIAVLLTTGYVDPASSAGTDRDASFLQLNKPWRMSELARRLRAALRAVPRPRLPEGIRPGGKRAVLVEDDALVRMITAEILAEVGYAVEAHSTGAAALAALEDRDAALLITDLGLPDMEGLDVARLARELVPDIAVIIASGGRDESEGGFTFLEKPYDGARLRAAIGRAMEHAGQPVA